MNSALNKKNGMQFIPETKLNYHPWIATLNSLDTILRKKGVIAFTTWQKEIGSE